MPPALRSTTLGDGNDDRHASRGPDSGAGEPQYHARSATLFSRALVSQYAARDQLVLALLFVAAVGLGPFAGVLGIGLHTWGSSAKLIADQIETVQLDPLRAVETTGAGRITAIVYALLPDIAPAVLSTTLFWWEFNVRASTVLGVVGAGEIGLGLKDSMDLLDFPRVFTIIAVILVVVTVLDQVSGWLRAKLV